MLPLYVSLAVAYLQSRVSRYAPLVGAVNSYLYTAVYLSYGLYALAASVFFVSGPTQIIAYIRWKKRPSGESTVLRALSVRAKILCSLGFAALWIIMLFVMKGASPINSMLENSATLFDAFAMILMMLSFIEYTPLRAAGAACNLVLYILMLGEHPEQITYLNLYDISSYLLDTCIYYRSQGL